MSDIQNPTLDLVKGKQWLILLWPNLGQDINCAPNLTSKPGITNQVSAAKIYRKHKPFLKFVDVCQI